MYKLILAEKDDYFGTITINQPEKRNMLSIEVLHEIEQALEEWKNDHDVKVIIFTGAGDKSFASGADIGQLKERTMIDALQPNMTATYRLIENYDKPTIAAINGIAVGGGLELALACDIRIAVKDAKLGLPELNLGIIPGAGGTQRLARIIGKGKAIELIFTGAIISGEEAEKINLISTAVERDQLIEVSKEYGQKVATKSPLALRIAKMVINKGLDNDMETALLLEKLGQTILMGSEDKNEGTSAFLEKRKPNFKGK